MPTTIPIPNTLRQKGKLPTVYISASSRYLAGVLEQKRGKLVTVTNVKPETVPLTGRIFPRGKGG